MLTALLSVAYNCGQSYNTIPMFTLSTAMEV